MDLGKSHTSCSKTEKNFSIQKKAIFEQHPCPVYKIILARNAGAVTPGHYGIEIL